MITAVKCLDMLHLVGFSRGGVSGEWRVKWLLMGLWVWTCGSAAIAPAKEFPQNVGPIKLADVRWQVLPDAVEAVFVGPDDRVWYQLKYISSLAGVPLSKRRVDDPAWHRLKSRAEERDRSLVRRIVAEQFNRAAPQLFGARPVLFEPEGRVWFLTDGNRLLLGYDGTRWIEYTAPEGHRFTGNCPNHGRLYGPGYNLKHGHTLFFAGTHGVHCFDGKNWHYQPVLDDQLEHRPHQRGPFVVPHMELYAEPDGHGVLATCPLIPPEAWRWRKGVWRRIDLTSERITDVLPSEKDGVWLLTRSHGVEFLPLSEPIHASEGFDALLTELNAADTGEARATVGDRMVARGVSIMPKIERALDETYDHDVINELVRVLEVLTQGGRTRMGGYEVGQLRLLHCNSQNGRCVFAVRGVSKDGTPLGYGTLTLNDGDEGTFHACTEPAEWWDTYFWSISGLLSTRDRGGLWVADRRADSRPRLLNLRAGRVIDEIPVSGFRVLHAIRRDGTIFVATNYPGQHAVLVGVYRPGKPDARCTLPTMTFPLAGDSDRVGVDSEGAVWADLENRGISRFSDGRWHAVPGLTGARGLSFFLPGEDGRVIGGTGSDLFYRTPQSVTRHPDIRQLVTANRADIAKTFGTTPPADRCIGTYVNGLVADRAGHIWLLWSRQLSVLIDGKWSTAKPALLSAGSRLGTVDYLNTVGGRNKVYVTDFMLFHDKGGSFYGVVENGRPVFAKAPHTRDRQDMCYSVRDQQDALWVAGSLGGSAGTADWISDQLALQLGDAGVVGELTNNGWARLCDDAGNVWLAEVRGGEANEFQVWRGGEIVDTIRVPTANESSQIRSDRAGSVYVWTQAGLYHLTATPESGYKDFEVDGSYSLADLPGHDGRFTVSRQGYGVFWIRAGSGRRRCHVSLVELIGKGGK